MFNWETILTNLGLIGLLSIGLGILVLLNILGGIAINCFACDQNFSWSKFFNGIGKALVICIMIMGLCLISETLPTILNSLGIVIPESLITLLEVVAVVLTAYKKYIIDDVDKLMILLGVKELECVKITGKENFNEEEVG